MGKETKLVKRMIERTPEYREELKRNPDELVRRMKRRMPEPTYKKVEWEEIINNER